MAVGDKVNVNGVTATGQSATVSFQPSSGKLGKLHYLKVTSATSISINYVTETGTDITMKSGTGTFTFGNLADNGTATYGVRNIPMDNSNYVSIVYSSGTFSYEVLWTEIG